MTAAERTADIMTTALMLIAIGKAIQARGGWVEFVDHSKHTYKIADIMAREIRLLSECTLRLMMQTKTTGSRVFIRSTMFDIKDGEKWNY